MKGTILTSFLKDSAIGKEKARVRLERHKKSESHKEAVLKLKSMQGPNIITQLSNEASHNQAQHPSMLLKQLQCLKFLLRQGLPICGHKESEDNLIQLRNAIIDCPTLEKWLCDSHYLSHNIVNKMITLMGNGNTILHQLLAKIYTVN